jgi:peptide-methionine (S)-S-oxide reductase
MTRPKAGRPPIDRSAPAEVEIADFALGCFWSPEARFGALDGVVRTCVGYAGGTTPEPTYARIGDHIETVRVAFDPTRRAYTDLLDVFWEWCDPMRAPFKRQYQTALFPRTDAQEAAVRESIEAVRASAGGEMAVEVIGGATFTRAEDYHQKYKLRHEDVVAQALQALYPDDDSFVDSPAAALANGYAGGYRDPARLDEDLAQLGLSGPAAAALRRVAERRY